MCSWTMLCCYNSRADLANRRVFYLHSRCIIYITVAILTGFYSLRFAVMLQKDSLQWELGCRLHRRRPMLGFKCALYAGVRLESNYHPAPHTMNPERHIAWHAPTSTASVLVKHCRCRERLFLATKCSWHMPICRPVNTRIDSYSYTKRTLKRVVGMS